MSVESLHQKIISRLNNPQQPTPCQIQRQIEENRQKQNNLLKLKIELDAAEIPPSLAKLANRGATFSANLKASIESLRTQPEGELLISLIEPEDIRSDGTIRIKRLKRKI